MAPSGSFSTPRAGEIPATLIAPGAGFFWMAVIATGVGTGLAALLLTRLLEFVQHLVWNGSGTSILEAACSANGLRHFFILMSAGVVTALGSLLLVRLTSGNGIDISAAIWFHAGRIPKWRTFGSAILSTVAVAMGASLGREGAPKQTGAVLANFFSDYWKISDEQRRLLVACGAGAGMAAAYGVPLGGALFSIEVLRGVLALRLILPTLLCSLIASLVAWTGLPNAPTYQTYQWSGATYSSAALLWALLLGPVAGFFSVLYVRMVAVADRKRPEGWRRFVAPVIALSLLGALSLFRPEVLGNGRDISQILLNGEGPGDGVLWILFLLKPFCIWLCIASGTPGGLFTPSLTCGALLGACFFQLVAGLLSPFFPAVPMGLVVLLGAGSFLAATTQGPISAAILLMELTGLDRTVLPPLMLAIVIATVVARTLEARSVYDARLTDNEVRERLRARAASIR